MQPNEVDDEEIEMLFKEIPHAFPPLHHHHRENQHQDQHHIPVLLTDGGCDVQDDNIYEEDLCCHGYGEIQNTHQSVSPVSIISLQSEGSSSSLVSFCGGFSMEGSGRGSSSPSLLSDEMKSQTPRKTHNQNGFFQDGDGVFESFRDEHDLSNVFQKMCIRDDEGLRKLERKVSFGKDESRGYWNVNSKLGFYEDSNVNPSSKFDTMVDPCWVGLKDCSQIGNQHWSQSERAGNVVMKGSNPCDSSIAFSGDFGGLKHPIFPNQSKLSSAGLNLQEQYRMASLPGSRLSCPFSNQTCQADSMNLGWQQGGELLNNGMTDEQFFKLKSAQISLQLGAGAALANRRGIRVPSMMPSVDRSSVADAFIRSQMNGIDVNNGDWSGLINPLSLPSMTHSELGSSFGNLPHFNSALFDRRVDISPYANTNLQGSPSAWGIPHSPFLPTRNGQFVDEDTFLIQGKILERNTFPFLNSPTHNGSSNLSARYKRDFHNNGANVCRNSYALAAQSFELDNGLDSYKSSSPRIYCPSHLPPKYGSLQAVEGQIYFIAKDQHGCRFLQRKFDEGTPQDVQMIFNEIIDHVIELMTNPFGNYLMQKLLDVCDEEQRMQIIRVVTGRPVELVNISLNTHGTRVVQKLIETLKTPQQVSLVISSLEPGVIDLIKDLNGNHVVQRCLQCLGSEDNKFLFDASVKYCVDVATHRHGCCVIQRCVDYSTGAHQQRLLAEVAANALVLAQDAFGNYVVQYVLNLEIPWVIMNIICQLEGNYVHLSMQKFSSNVVEKCLKLGVEDKRVRIIHELLSTSRFEELLQDPFANYVVQKALEVCKGSVHASLVEAIRPHLPALRSSPYSKRILSRTISKK